MKNTEKPTQAKPAPGPDETQPDTDEKLVNPDDTFFRMVESAFARFPAFKAEMREEDFGRAITYSFDFRQHSECP